MSGRCLALKLLLEFSSSGLIWDVLFVTKKSSKLLLDFKDIQFLVELSFDRDLIKSAVELSSFGCSSGSLIVGDCIDYRMSGLSMLQSGGRGESMRIGRTCFLM